ncbi:hypothetical protein GIB67_004919 [Kingdonia uniflora]|uniref:Major facilitator superfamily (MFS) profile domain-containing protein n=1 Tax=Kingdonia uniflora TaxID=39325 RepID=A0A7J7LNV9_9MAGN|nr:hypothetical protein GIB67_004919 [Kingdonia uniflora]
MILISFISIQTSSRRCCAKILSGYVWLAGMTVVIAVLSENVVGIIEDESKTWRLSVSFIGVISGALLYIRDDFQKVDRSNPLMETIVSMVVVGAIVCAAIGVPAIIQFILMMFLPESPHWLYRKHVYLTSFLFYKDRKEEAGAIWKKLCPPDKVKAKVEYLSNTVVHKGLTAGIGCQAAQQFMGISTVMYYSPTIVQLAGYASNSMALALSLITFGLNAFGSIVSMVFVNRYGRRKLLLVRMVRIIICLLMLTGTFEFAKNNAPAVSGVNTATFGNSTCVDYTNAPHPIQQTGTACHVWLPLMIVASALILVTM